jgi:chromosome segregation ATPase
MTNPQITTDLATILERIEVKIDKQSEQLNNKIDKQSEQLNNKIEKLNDKIDKLTEQVGQLKVEQAKVSEKLQGLEDKIKTQDKRLDSIEFVNRGIFVGLTLAVLGGFAKIFGFIGNKP